MILSWEAENFAPVFFIVVNVRGREHSMEIMRLIVKSAMNILGRSSGFYREVRKKQRQGGASGTVMLVASISR